MVSVGDDAPDFTAPMAHGDAEVSTFTLSENLHDGPVVLAFFPAAFTGTCTTELSTFQDQLGNFDDLGATVYGVSVDLPFALNEFREQEGLSFPLLSDGERDLVEAYGVEMDFGDIGVERIAKRSVFVVDEDGEVVYKWVSDDPGVEPDYEAVEAAAATAANQVEQ